METYRCLVNFEGWRMYTSVCVPVRRTEFKFLASVIPMQYVDGINKSLTAPFIDFQFNCYHHYHSQPLGEGSKSFPVLEYLFSICSIEDKLLNLIQFAPSYTILHLYFILISFPILSHSRWWDDNFSNIHISFSFKKKEEWRHWNTVMRYILSEITLSMQDVNQVVIEEETVVQVRGVFHILRKHTRN